MAKITSASNILSGMRTPNQVDKTRKLRRGMVPDRAPDMSKVRALLAGDPSSVRGRKPRLGGL